MVFYNFFLILHGYFVRNNVWSKSYCLCLTSYVCSTATSYFDQSNLAKNISQMHPPPPSNSFLHRVKRPKVPPASSPLCFVCALKLHRHTSRKFSLCSSICCFVAGAASSRHCLTTCCLEGLNVYGRGMVSTVLDWLNGTHAQSRITYVYPSPPQTPMLIKTIQFYHNVDLSRQYDSVWRS